MGAGRDAGKAAPIADVAAQHAEVLKSTAAKIGGDPAETVKLRDAYDRKYGAGAADKVLGAGSPPQYQNGTAF